MSPSSPRPPVKSLYAATLRGTDVAICMLVALVAVVGGYYAIVLPLIDASSGARVNSYIAWGALYSLSLLGTVWLVLARRRRLSFADLGWIRLGRIELLAAFALGLLCLFVSWAAFGIVDAIFNAGSPYSFGIAPTTTLFEAAALILFVGVLSPFAEELFYRGVLFRWMRQRLQFWPAAIASSILFGLVHIYVDAIINAAVAGVLFAWLFERSGSLLMSTIVHQTWNSVSVATTWIERASAI